MSGDLIIVLVILTGVVFGLTFLRVTPDVILMAGLAGVIVTGVVEPKQALSGFGNEGLITVALLFIIAEGLRQTGAIRFLGNQLGQPKNLVDAQARLLIPSAAFSAFMNNTPVVAILLPVVTEWAQKIRLSVSHLMLPLSYAAILGGLCTLIGTSTTLVVNGLLIETGHPGLGLFELGWVGVPACALGLVYLLATSRWLLPERKSAFDILDDPREYTVEMMVEPSSPLIEKSIEEAGLRNLPGMYLMEIDRDGHILPAVGPQERLRANDRLVFVGVVDSVIELQKIGGLALATDQIFKLDSPRSQRTLIEAVVSNSFPFLRMTIRESRFRTHYNAVVVAVGRNGQRIRRKIGDIELQPGDTLLLEAPKSFLELQRHSRDFFLVSAIENSEPPNLERAWIARLILAGMVLSVSFEWLSMLKAAFLGSGLMVLTRCCRASQAKRSIDMNVLLTIAGGLGLGEAMRATGAANWIADGLISAVGDRPRTVMVILYALTAILTNLITAKAAAVLLFPIAVAAAHSLGGLDITPFAIMVIVAAAASFATPVGYQTNLMVYGPGGYRQSDYLRLGGPLTILVGIVTILVTPYVWPINP